MCTCKVSQVLGWLNFLNVYARVLVCTNTYLLSACHLKFCPPKGKVYQWISYLSTQCLKLTAVFSQHCVVLRKLIHLHDNFICKCSVSASFTTAQFCSLTDLCNLCRYGRHHVFPTPWARVNWGRTPSWQNMVPRRKMADWEGVFPEDLRARCADNHLLCRVRRGRQRDWAVLQVIFMSCGSSQRKCDAE